MVFEMLLRLYQFSKTAFFRHESYLLIILYILNVGIIVKIFI